MVSNHAMSSHKPDRESSALSGRIKENSGNMKKVIAFMAALLLLTLLAPGLSESGETDNKRISDLPEGVDSLRIVYVADLHREAGSSDSGLADFVGAINSLYPDLVILGGDYGTEPDSSVMFFEEMKDLRIRTRYGAYAIIGEADRVDYPEEPVKLTEAMISAGFNPLVNQVACILLPGGTVMIAGLDDIICGLPDFEAIAERVESSDFVIFLAHDPSALGNARLTPDRNGGTDWIDLGLFGHAEMRDPDIVENIGWVEENILFSDGTGAIYCIDISR